MFLGIDFGTTNTVAAVMDGAGVRVLPLDEDASTLRTMLYIEREGAIRAGAEAIRTYRAQNVGRVPRLSRQWVGEIEILIGELNVKGYDVGGSVTAIVDAFADVDADAPGRLIHALKGPLATPYTGTRLFGKDYTLEALIAEFLAQLRSRIAAQMGRAPRNAVFGRPVHFAHAATREADDRAQARLLQAAQMAGFERVIFEAEPVGAALAFGAPSTSSGSGGEQHVLVFDFGGGTLDVAVVRFAGDAHDVLATGGIGIGGDAFDQIIFRKALLPWFGSESTWGNGHALPAHLMEALGDWQDIPQLATAGTLRFIREAQHTSSDPLRLLALEDLISKGYAYDVYAQVEQAKVALSARRFAVIDYFSGAVSLWQPISRAQFESFIARERRMIAQVIDDTLQRAGVEASQIDRVVRTGGSSSIPVFVDLLGDRFGREKIVAQSLFTGVASGLAVKAAQLNLEC
jgi:hypothetical chaperone protein